MEQLLHGAPMPEEWYDLGTELCVRVKEDQDRDFIARLKADSEKLYRVGNVFIADVRSFTDIRRNFQQSHTNAGTVTFSEWVSCC